MVSWVWMEWALGTLPRAWALEAPWRFEHGTPSPRSHLGRMRIASPREVDKDTTLEEFQVSPCTCAPARHGNMATWPLLFPPVQHGTVSVCVYSCLARTRDNHRLRA
jgi:hypothetical protein